MYLVCSLRPIIGDIRSIFRKNGQNRVKQDVTNTIQYSTIPYNTKIVTLHYYYTVFDLLYSIVSSFFLATKLDSVWKIS
jgi:hypothetical protein